MKRDSERAFDCFVFCAVSLVGAVCLSLYSINRMYYSDQLLDFKTNCVLWINLTLS